MSSFGGENIARYGIGNDRTVVKEKACSSDPKRNGISFRESAGVQRQFCNDLTVSWKGYGHGKQKRSAGTTGAGCDFRRYSAPPCARDAKDGSCVRMTKDTDWRANSGLDQNRASIGFGFERSPRSRVSTEIGYLNQFLNRPKDG